MIMKTQTLIMSKVSSHQTHTVRDLLSGHSQLFHHTDFFPEHTPFILIKL